VKLPVEALERAGLEAGDEVIAEAEGLGRIVIRKAGRDPADALGIFDGLYEPDYLERLRADRRR
jgi:bifunctional DNA-binding transcriptional regulator/antitoxin component of YhaV-PrlF toxin-antitoxin module